MDDRAVSNPVGVVLLIGMTIASVTAMFAAGGAVIDDTRADTERSQMENAMSGFSSKASLVGLGEAGEQRFSLGRVSEGDVSIRENAGRVSIYLNYSEKGKEEVANISMGAVVYSNRDTEIAYQGGGVWRRSNGGSNMISPPEYHYRLETLTFPILNITGEDSARGRIRGTVQSSEMAEQLYPDPGRDFRNPLKNGTVEVEIESDYCKGWESFFESRSQGSVTGCDENNGNTVMVDLTTSFDPAFGSGVTSAYPIEGKVNPDPSREGVVAPPPDDLINEKIETCGGCTSFSSSDELKNGTYYTEDASDFDGLTINTTDGNVNVVINDQGADTSVNNNIKIDGEHNVSVYMNVKSLSMKSQTSINEGGNASQLITYMDSNVSSINLNSKASYTGGIYAPETLLQGKGNNGGGDTCNGGGGGGGVSITGSVVVKEFCFNAGNLDFEYEPQMADLDIEVAENTIKYLHVSESSVTVELS